MLQGLFEMKDKSKKERKEFYESMMQDEDHYRVEEQKHGWVGNFHRQQLEIYKEILKKASLKKGAKVLDIGCGPYSIGEFIPEGFDITAFDLSEKNIRRAKAVPRNRKLKIRFLVDDAQEPKKVKGKFDLLFAGEIIEHLPSPQTAMKNWAGLVKKGGFLIVSTPNASIAKPSKEHISLQHIHKLSGLLEKNGFRVLEKHGVALGIPGMNPFGRIFLSWHSGLSDWFFEKIMRSVKRKPEWAYDVIYFAKKVD